MKVLVLCSGGMDSVTALHWAARSHEVAGVVSFDYGAKHNARELPFAAEHAAAVGAPHTIIPLDFIGRHFASNLLKGAPPVPEGHYEDTTMRQTVVPFRNGIMLAAAGGLAESIGAAGLVIAAHSGDHVIYPDCRESFMEAMAAALRAGTYAGIELLRPFIAMNKAAIAAEGARLGVDFSRTWSCYAGGAIHCGKCGTCVERREAFIDAGLSDPTEYADNGPLPPRPQKGEDDWENEEFESYGNARGPLREQRDDIARTRLMSLRSRAGLRRKQPIPELATLSPMLISEIFHSIQGEGELTGVPSVFVRTSGCNLRCTWCDTPYASWNPEGDAMTVDEIVARVTSFRARHVVLTGGEPMIAPGIRPLAAALRDAGMHITIETAATIAPLDIVCDLASLSPKLRNSSPDDRLGDVWRERHESLRWQPAVVASWMAMHDYQLKFVVATRDDLEEIEVMLGELPVRPPLSKVLLMPEGVDAAQLRERGSWLAEVCRDCGYRFCPRLHIELFGNRRGT